MDLLNDLEFLRRDNANLFNEVQFLRQQSNLLRERSKELERRLREHNVPPNKPGSSEEKKRISFRDSKISGPPTSPKDAGPGPVAPVLHLDTSLSEPQIVIRSTEFQSPRISIAWDDSPIERVSFAPSRDIRRFSGRYTSVHNGPFLIGEAPANKSAPEVEPSHDLPAPITFSPPSPDPSEPRRNIRIPSLRSVIPPVSGVALPNVPATLLEFRLIKKETYDTPAAVASFMHKLTHTIHIPRSTYRAAFIDAFTYIIPLLGPTGSLSAEWLAFLHDFPSRIPASHRDSLVSIVWPEQGVVPKPSGINTEDGYNNNENISHADPSRRNLHPSNRRDYKRRSRSMDVSSRITQPPMLPPIVTDSRGIAELIAGPSAPCDNAKPATNTENAQPNDVNAKQNTGSANQTHEVSKRKEDSTTHSPPCERDAWVLLLALAYAALPDSKVAKKLARLPVDIRLQMVAWMPPGVRVYANMEFASTAVDETLNQIWDSKKEILRLKNGWE